MDTGGQERESLATSKFPSWETLVGMVVPAYRLGTNRMYPSGCTWNSQVKWIEGSKGFPGGSAGKESTCNVVDMGSIPGSGRSLEEGMATHSSTLA